MKFKVTINWYGEVHVIYTHAKDANKALNNACHQLAKLVGYNFGYVKSYVKDENKNRFNVEVINYGMDN